MSVTATWTVLNAEGEDSGEEMVIHAPADIDELLTALARPGSTAALIRHHERPTVFDEDLGQIPDHDVTVGVWQGFGYLSFADLDHEYAYPIGDPDSPGFAGDYADYPPGTGLDLETLRPALAEFLQTMQRPILIRWRKPQ